MVWLRWVVLNMVQFGSFNILVQVTSDTFSVEFNRNQDPFQGKKNACERNKEYYFNTLESLLNKVTSYHWVITTTLPSYLAQFSTAILPREGAAPPTN